jgi:sulfite reductase (ferredoxin)
MKSFRTEIENPIVEKDIIELEKKIHLYQGGQLDEERFRSLRLARGIYGQRQLGVQMIRIKLPYGKVTGNQLLRICDVADEYSNGKLHITTRQDIQIHHVSLERTPELWAQLERDDLTLREACGNTVRNVTASALAGVDKEEPFDVTPYADAVFQFFLRNPICQEMGRKFKISFSASDKDTALSYIHDLGFIPKIKEGSRGFKVLLGGGLGSQPRHADVLFEFLPCFKLIPMIESILRVFDRYGERTKRQKARMKFLIKKIGLEAFISLVEQEQKALSIQRFEINIAPFEKEITVKPEAAPPHDDVDFEKFMLWKKNHVIPQKQEGFFALGLKIKLGDISTEKVRVIAHLIKKYAANELRFSLRQNLIIRYVKEDFLPFFYQELTKLGLADLGFNSAADITACPGTDTCNLGIASSTGMAVELERVLRKEYPKYLENKDLTIKISGCMNACGQHNMAHIGFQGMSIKTKEKLVVPAVQILLGGGVLGNGKGRFADKVIKLPSKRSPQALRIILDDFEIHRINGESFLDYYDKKGKLHFYTLLMPLSSTENLNEEDFIDWGNEARYVQAVGVGECAGTMIDLVATLMLDAEEKISLANTSFKNEKYADAIYHSYSAFINGAKALLISENKKTNTQAEILAQFDEIFVNSKKIHLGSDLKSLVYQIKSNEPSLKFAESYYAQAIVFLEIIKKYRKKELHRAT